MNKTMFALLVFNTTYLFAQPNTHDALVSRLHVPEHFKLSVFADNVPHARSLALGDHDVVFVGTINDSVYAIQDSDGDGVADKRYTIATGLNRPNGVAFKDGSLYVAEIDRISRYDHIIEHLAQPPQPKMVYDQLPKESHHGQKYLKFGPDGKLYTSIGSPCNVCKPSYPHGTLIRLNADGSQFEVLAEGVRSVVGFDWHPDTKALYFTDNGRDLMGDDVPPEEVNLWTTPGEHFGFPYWHGGDVPDDQFSPENSSQTFTPPVWKFKAHVAPLGAHFYRGQQWPANYHHQLLVAQHGSWNRSKPDGYRVIAVKFVEGKPAAEETLIDGWLDKNDQVLGRPVDIMELADGSVLISDDQLGIIYKLTYQVSPGQP